MGLDDLGGHWPASTPCYGARTVIEPKVLKAIDEVYENIYRANSALRLVIDMQTADADRSEIADEEDLASYHVQAAYVQLLTLLESLGLRDTYGMVMDLYKLAAKDGWTKTRVGREEPYLVWAGELHVYIDALRTMYAMPADVAVPRDLESILRNCLYAITDKACFAPPAKEAEVHDRIEMILRCIFPDLVRKPPLNKPIKNFIPDTGLPSVKTLIEYKFISDADEAKRVADEILADTRGYASPDWTTFFFVIYETTRIRTEAEWIGLLKASDIPDTTRIILLQGEPPPDGKKATGAKKPLPAALPVAPAPVAASPSPPPPPPAAGTAGS